MLSYKPLLLRNCRSKFSNFQFPIVGRSTVNGRTKAWQPTWPPYSDTMCAKQDMRQEPLSRGRAHAPIAMCALPN